MQQVPMAAALFTWPPGARSASAALVASAASASNRRRDPSFPYRRQVIIDGVREDLERIELPALATLWTSTIHTLRPPPRLTQPRTDAGLAPFRSLRQLPVRCTSEAS